jgi:hypothetical protein
MEVMASEIPLKDGGNMVTKVSSGNQTEGMNSSTNCGDEGAGITAELHNGGEQLGTPNDSQDDPKAKKKENENLKTTPRTGDPSSESLSEDDEKWRLHLDATDSASTSDYDAREVEANGANREKLPGDNNPLLDTDADDSVDFLGFEMGTASSEDSSAVELTKLIGKRLNLFTSGTVLYIEDVVMNGIVYCYCLLVKCNGIIQGGVLNTIIGYCNLIGSKGEVMCSIHCFVDSAFNTFSRKVNLPACFMY